jgi:hypothetical protein
MRERMIQLRTAQANPNKIHSMALSFLLFAFLYAEKFWQNVITALPHCRADHVEKGRRKSVAAFPIGDGTRRAVNEPRRCTRSAQGFNYFCGCAKDRHNAIVKRGFKKSSL